LETRKNKLVIRRGQRETKIPKKIKKL